MISEYLSDCWRYQMKIVQSDGQLELGGYWYRTQWPSRSVGWHIMSLEICELQPCWHSCCALQNSRSPCRILIERNNYELCGWVVWWVSRVSLIIKLSADLATYSQGHSDTPNSRSAHGQLGLTCHTWKQGRPSFLPGKHSSGGVLETMIGNISHQMDRIGFELFS